MDILNIVYGIACIGIAVFLLFLSYKGKRSNILKNLDVGFSLFFLTSATNYLNSNLSHLFATIILIFLAIYSLKNRNQIVELLEARKNFEDYLNTIQTAFKKIKESDAKLTKDALAARVLVEEIVARDYLPRVAWDFEGKFLFVNSKFSEALGYTQEEMLNKSFYDFIHPDDIRSSKDLYEKNIKTLDKLTEFSFENRYICKDKTIMKVQWVRGFNDPRLKIGSGQVKFIRDGSKS